jgi:hypothetical protein
VLAEAGTLRGTAITEGTTLLVAVGDAGLLARSTHQSKTFRTLRIKGAANLFDVALDAAGGLALAVDSAGNIWVSHDAARNFTRRAHGDHAARRHLARSHRHAGVRGRRKARPVTLDRRRLE